MRHTHARRAEPAASEILHPHQVDAFASLTPTAWSTNGHSANKAALLSATE